MKTNNTMALKERSATTRRVRNSRVPSQSDVVLSTVVSDSSVGVAWEDVVPLQRRRRTRPGTAASIVPAGNQSRPYLAVKRTLDVAVAGLLLVVLSPFLLAIIAVLLITTKGHPIFGQERLGYLGKPFRLYKFRTMRLDAETLRSQVKNEQDGPIFKNHNDPRITRIGKLLRRTSIDEIPQLVNILRGDMSLVGPRPPLAEEVARYAPWQRIRLAVKPGLTCLWQVSGRSEIGFERWMLMDSWYVKHQGLLTDLGLLIRTPKAIFSRRGAY